MGAPIKNVSREGTRYLMMVWLLVGCTRLSRKERGNTYGDRLFRGKVLAAGALWSQLPRVSMPGDRDVSIGRLFYLLGVVG